MKTTFIVTIFSAFMLLSCGKSKYEKELDKAFDEYDKVMDEAWKDYDKAMDEYENSMKELEREIDSWNY